jgi:aryl-alcohol dehydrogenase-like predicted oxidoreductase
MEMIAPVAAAHQSTAAQIVIAWTLQQPGITFSLCGARNPAQAKENAQAARIRLAADELKAISEAAERHLKDLDA